MVVDDNAVGVPEIKPVDELNVNPAGKDGEIEYEVTGLPELEIEYSAPTLELITPNPD